MKFHFRPAPEVGAAEVVCAVRRGVQCARSRQCQAALTAAPPAARAQTQLGRGAKEWTRCRRRCRRLADVSVGCPARETLEREPSPSAAAAAASSRARRNDDGRQTQRPRALHSTDSGRAAESAESCRQVSPCPSPTRAPLAQRALPTDQCFSTHCAAIITVNCSRRRPASERASHCAREPL